jgi:hypothetical protein
MISSAFPPAGRCADYLVCFIRIAEGTLSKAGERVKDFGGRALGKFDEPYQCQAFSGFWLLIPYRMHGMMTHRTKKTPGSRCGRFALSRFKVGGKGRHFAWIACIGCRIFLSDSGSTGRVDSFVS